MKGKEREKMGKGRKDERGEECKRGKEKDAWGRLENKEGGKGKEVE